MTKIFLESGGVLKRFLEKQVISPMASSGLISFKSADRFLEIYNKYSHKIDNTTENNPISVYLGGPVEPNRGFVLHTSDYMHESTLIINNIFAVTSSLDIMKDICKGRGPKHSILAIGYAGGGNGQLDQEILTNGWLIAPADTNLVFETKNNMKWDLSAQNIGINIEKLSGDLGQA